MIGFAEAVLRVFSSLLGLKWIASFEGGFLGFGDGGLLETLFALGLLWLYLYKSENGVEKGTITKRVSNLQVIGMPKAIAYRNFVKVVPLALIWLPSESFLGYRLISPVSIGLQIVGACLLIFIIIELIIDNRGPFYDRKYGTRVMQYPSDWRWNTP